MTEMDIEILGKFPSLSGEKSTGEGLLENQGSFFELLIKEEELQNRRLQQLEKQIIMYDEDDISYIVAGSKGEIESYLQKHENYIKQQKLI